MLPSGAADRPFLGELQLQTTLGDAPALIGVRVRIEIADRHDVVAEMGLLTFADHSTLGYGTLIWAAGVKAITPPIEPAFPPGPLKSDAFLQLDEHLYGAGDAILYEQDGIRAPKNAQSALHMAQDVLTNVLRRIKGQPPVAPSRQQMAALVTVLQTGFFRFGTHVLQGQWIHPFRKALYRLRLWQIKTGR